MHRLAELGFIGLKPGPLGDLSYAVFYNPYHVVKRAYLADKVQERKWQALVVRAFEVGSFDLDELDDEGNLIPAEKVEEPKPATSPSQAKAAPKTQLKGRTRKIRI